MGMTRRTNMKSLIGKGSMHMTSGGMKAEAAKTVMKNEKGAVTVIERGIREDMIGIRTAEIEIEIVIDLKDKVRGIVMEKAAVEETTETIGIEETDQEKGTTLGEIEMTVTPKGTTRTGEDPALDLATNTISTQEEVRPDVPQKNKGQERSNRAKNLQGRHLKKGWL